MRIQLASDLHLELLQERWPAERLLQPAPGAELLVLAGDIHRSTQAITLFADWPVPVLYLAGNHEFYRASLNELRAQLRQAAAGTRVHFLDDDAMVLDGVRFLGSTLWSDYAINGADPAEEMDAAERLILDHQRIRMDSGFFMPQDALEQHRRSRAWLLQDLQRPFDGPTVVVTHHAPHPGSIHPRFADSPVNGSFVSDLGDLVARADLWLHGHVHDSFDYRVDRCRVVANPRGYALNRKEAPSPVQLEFENARFTPELVIEVPG